MSAGVSVSSRPTMATVPTTTPTAPPTAPSRVSCLLDQMGRQRDRDIQKAVLDCLHGHRRPGIRAQAGSAGAAGAAGGAGEVGQAQTSPADLASYQAWLCSAETHSLSRLLTLGFILNNGVVLLAEEGDQAELLGNLAESRLVYSLGHTLAQMPLWSNTAPEHAGDSTDATDADLSQFEQDLMALSVCDSPTCVVQQEAKMRLGTGHQPGAA